MTAQDECLARGFWPTQTGLSITLLAPSALHNLKCQRIGREYRQNRKLTNSAEKLQIRNSCGNRVIRCVNTIRGKYGTRKHISETCSVW